MANAPLPLIDCGRVLAYAIIPDEIPFTDRLSLFVDGVLLGRVPCLAICEQLNDGAFLLMHCDDEWLSLGVTGGMSVEYLKEIAEKNYPGIAALWVDVNTSLEDALNFYDANCPTDRCLVCGKRSFEVQTSIAEGSGFVCDGCSQKSGRLG